MAALEALQELRNDVMSEFQKVATLQEDHRVKVQEVVDTQMKADQAGLEHHRWKVDNENRIVRQDNQQSTLALAVAELLSHISKSWRKVVSDNRPMLLEVKTSDS